MAGPNIFLKQGWTSMAVEGDLLKKIMMAVSEKGDRLFRNNVGEGWVCSKRDMIFHKDGTITMLKPRRLTAGLCVGSSDLIGWKKILITPDLIGRPVAQFMAVEAKTKGVAVTPQQKNFIHQVNNNGGYGIVARSEEEIY